VLILGKEFRLLYYHRLVFSSAREVCVIIRDFMNQPTSHMWFILVTSWTGWELWTVSYTIARPRYDKGFADAILTTSTSQESKSTSTICLLFLNLGTLITKTFCPEGP
jgi:hypothetical protein